MYQYDSYNYGREMNARWGWTAFIVALAVAASALSITVWDGEGRKDHDHTIALPGKVEQLDRSHYLVAGRAIAPSDLCRGGVQGNEGVANVRDLRRVDLQYVECYHDQSWNDHRARSLNWWGAATHFLRTIPIDILLALSLGGALYIPLSYRHRARSIYKRRQKQEMVDHEKARLLATAEQDKRFDRLKRDLEGAWTRADDPISDEDYERKLGLLLERRDRGDL